MYHINDLRYLMERLRNPLDGCPWDLKQDYQSVAPHTLEETYEVLDAIERNDKQAIKEELGDLLFQVVFYAQIGAEEGTFNWDDVVSGIVEKLLRRHPHVFPDGTLESRRDDEQVVDEDSIAGAWDKIKSEEKRNQGFATNPSILDDIPKAFPSLLKAQKLQKKAARHGFDWSHISQVYPKVIEELDEVREALGDNEKYAGTNAVAEELGDLLFACVNLARFAKVDADQALRLSNIKFEERYRLVEQFAAEQRTVLVDMTEKQLDDLWEKAKRELRSGSGSQDSSEKL